MNADLSGWVPIFCTTIAATILYSELIYEIREAGK